MTYEIFYHGDLIGMALVSGRVTDEQICDIAGIELARTQQDYEYSPYNGKYDLSELVIQIN